MAKDWLDGENQPEMNVGFFSEAERCEDSESLENTDESVEKAGRIESRITFANRSSVAVSSSSTRRNVTCKKGHPLEIESVNVTKALREFAEKSRRTDGEQNSSLRDKFPHGKVTSLSRHLTNEDVTLFWKRYRDIFSTTNEKLWDGLLIGLHKYHEILKERHRLNNETKCLKKQNAELKRLLETYVVKVCIGRVVSLALSQFLKIIHKSRLKKKIKNSSIF